MDYLISEGEKLGYMPTEFGADGSITESKIVAGADVTKGQILVMSDAMTVVPSSAASNQVIGVAMFDAANTKPVSVECRGLVRLTASGAITVPTRLKSAAGGKVAAWVSGTDAADLIVGIALSDATDGKQTIARLTL